MGGEGLIGGDVEGPMVRAGLTFVHGHPGRWKTIAPRASPAGNFGKMSDHYDVRGSGPVLGHVSWQLLLLGLTLVLMGFTVDASVGLLSGRLSSALRASRRVAHGLNIFSGTVFAGLAVRLVAAPQ